MELPEDVLRAIVAAAAKHEPVVAAHAQGGAAIAAAARAGVGSIEHGAQIDDEAAGVLHERRVDPLADVEALRRVVFVMKGDAVVPSDAK